MGKINNDGVEVTPEALAEKFDELNGKEMAAFFNHLGDKYVKIAKACENIKEFETAETDFDKYTDMVGHLDNGGISMICIIADNPRCMHKIIGTKVMQDLMKNFDEKGFDGLRPDNENL